MCTKHKIHQRSASFDFTKIVSGTLMLVYLGERASFVLVGAAILFPSRLSAKKRRYSKFHKMSIAFANPREVARQRRQSGGEEKISAANINLGS